MKLSPLIVLKTLGNLYYVGKCRQDTNGVWLAHERHSVTFNTMSGAITALVENNLLDTPIVNDLKRFVSLTPLMMEDTLHDK
jgi:hypothetical protein